MTVVFFKDCPGRRAKLGSYGFRLFSLSKAVSLTARLLRPPVTIVFNFELNALARILSCCSYREQKITKLMWSINFFPNVFLCYSEWRNLTRFTILHYLQFPKNLKPKYWRTNHFKTVNLPRFIKSFLKRWAIPGLLFFIFIFSIAQLGDKVLLMSWFEPRITGVGSDCATNLTTTTGLFT